MELSSVTLSQLRYVVAIDRARSFREAAKACNVSQPALSMQVQKLEETLGDALFDRRQPITPTDFGERVLAQARIVMREADRLTLIAREAHGELEGTYRLGIIPTLASSMLPRMLPRFALLHAKVSLQIEELETEVLLERLRRDDIDGGIASTPLNATGIHERPLFEEALYAYLPQGHRLAKKNRVKQSDLVADRMWILAEGHCFGEQVLQLCHLKRPDVDTPVDFQSGTFETLIGLVDAGFGVTVLPQLIVDALPAARRREQVRPFTGPTPMREVSFIHARQHLRRGIADALAKTAQLSLPSPDSTRRKLLSPRVET